MSAYDVLRLVLSDRPIAFNPELARAFGSINEALFFQQITYWSDKGDNPEWIYKSQVELKHETCLLAYQQKQARNYLKRLAVGRRAKSMRNAGSESGFAGGASSPSTQPGTARALLCGECFAKQGREVLFSL